MIITEIKADTKNTNWYSQYIGNIPVYRELSGWTGKIGFACLKNGGWATQIGVRFEYYGSPVKVEFEDRSTAAQFG